MTKKEAEKAAEPEAEEKPAKAPAAKKATIKGAQQAGKPSWPSQPGVPPPENL